MAQPRENYHFFVQTSKGSEHVLISSNYMQSLKVGKVSPSLKMEEANL